MIVFICVLQIIGMNIWAIILLVGAIFLGLIATIAILIAFWVNNSQQEVLPLCATIEVPRTVPVTIPDNAKPCLDGISYYIGTNNKSYDFTVSPYLTPPKLVCLGVTSETCINLTTSSKCEGPVALASKGNTLYYARNVGNCI